MIVSLFTQPWPWYVSGPLIGLIVPMLLFLGDKHFGISSSFRHLCAMVPSKVTLFNYAWKDHMWSLLFVLGLIVGGAIAGLVVDIREPIAIAEATAQGLQAQGLDTDGGFAPASLFSWSQVLTLRGFIIMGLGGFLIGFGTRYADGCTSGHAILGLAELQLPSLVAVIGFFAGGLLMANVILPLIIRL